MGDDKRNTKIYSDSKQASQAEGDAEKRKDGPWIKQFSDIFDTDGRWIKDPLACHFVSIYKVPAPIRSIKEEAFKPQVVSFGPISRRKDEQRCPMDYYKLDAMKRTLKRVNDIRKIDGEDDFKMGDLVEEVKRLQTKIRNSYENRAIEWDEQSLAWTLTMDACFILEFLRSSDENHGGFQFSLVFNNADNGFVNAIRMDILKLENQIPLFILERILQLEGKCWAHFLGALLDNSILFRGFPFSDNLSCKQEIQCAHHLLDLCSKVITGYLTKGNANPTSASATGSRGQGHYKSIPSAEKLKKSGIKFKAGERVSFERSTFSLHSILVDDDTEIMLRNLIAFEECQKCKPPPHTTTISEYIRLMGDLIDSEADVVLLEKAETIKRFTGVKQIVAMFNTLCTGITESTKNPFKRELEKIEEHYNQEFNLWKVEFKERYCSKPWLIVSLLGAILLLALTIVQTVLAIVQTVESFQATSSLTSLVTQ